MRPGVQFRASHPTRVRGLKPALPRAAVRHLFVAPHAGAWIETSIPSVGSATGGVAPHAGAWIETTMRWVNGSKNAVAPHAGAWIETGQGSSVTAMPVGRTPRGCVD